MTTNANTNFPPRHVRLSYKLKTRLKNTIAQTRMNLRTVQWQQSAEQFASLTNSQKEATLAPVTVIGGSQGLGKTAGIIRAIRQMLKTNPNWRILFLAPTTSLGTEVETAARAAGITANLIRGRGQPNPDGNGTMCQRADLAQTVAALGMPVKSTLCRRESEDGTVSECPFYKTCAYNAQMETAQQGGLIIAAHQYLSIPLDILKTVDFVIVDESYWQTLTRQSRIDLGRFLTARSIGKGFRGNREKSEEANFELGQAIETVRFLIDRAQQERRQITLQDFREQGWTAEHCKYLAGLEYSRFAEIEIEPDMEGAEVASILKDAEAQEALGFARVWKCLGSELATNRNGPFTGFRIRYGVPHIKTRELQNIIHLHWMRDTRFKNVPTLILDANADRNITRRTYPNASIFRIEAAWQNTKLIQAHDWTGTMSALKLQTNRDDAFNLAVKVAIQSGDLIEAAPTAKERKARRPVLISTKAVIDSFREDGSLARAPFDADHFGNIRGKDGMKETAALVIVGRPEPSADDLESLARCIYAATDHEFEDFLQEDEKGNKPLPKWQHLMKAKDGNSQLVEVSGHPNPLVHGVLLQIREAELMQTAARVRPIWRSAEIPCLIVALTNIPLAVMPDEIWKKSQIVPDMAEKMIMHGAEFETAQDAADAFPDLGKSAGNVRTFYSRREARALPLDEARFAVARKALQTPNNNKQGNVTPLVRLTYRRTLKRGSRAGAVWFRLRSGDTAEKLKARLRAYLPDAYDIDARIPETTSQRLAGRPQPARDSATGLPFVDPAMITLAWATAEEPRVWNYSVRHRKKVYEQRC
ncbi:hypothetical protein ACC685_33480 [Rhizobium ruizarguesonis]